MLFIVYYTLFFSKVILILVFVNLCKTYAIICDYNRNSLKIFNIIKLMTAIVLIKFFKNCAYVSKTKTT